MNGVSQDLELGVSSFQTGERGWEKALGLEVVIELDPRLGLLSSGLGGLKRNHSRVP